MSRFARRPWLHVSIVLLLLATLLPVTATAPAAAQSSNDPSDSPCTGDPSADYLDQCGPSVAIPGWSDGGGWNNDLQAGTIELVDLNGDGTDELVGLGPHGVQVHSFLTDLGQWVQAYSDTDPLPFANNAVLGGLNTVRFGQLTESKWGVIGIVFDVANNNALVGLETWSWNSGNGSVGSGSWTLEQTDGPFGPGSTPDWTSNPGYWSTIQFVSEPLEGVGYSIIARGNTGMVRCSWDDANTQWWCGHAGDAFDDSEVIDVSTLTLAPYLYGTIQTADIYQETAGPELFGLQYSPDANERNLKVYSWDSGSQQFVPLQTSGYSPFWSPQGQWFNVKYSSTIQAAQLLGGDNPLQVIGRSQYGLEWHSLNDTGCGGLTPPCWQNLTQAGNGQFSDNAGFDDPQYYATMRYADIDGDGVDELVARDPNTSPAGQISVWNLHPNAGWYQQQGWSTPELSGGPADDPLWSTPGYYETIQIGNITGAGFLSMIARGKYGIRTWTIQNGFARPQAYGFDPFTTAEQNAYALAGAFVGLDPNSGTAIRDQYSAGIPDTLTSYQTCLDDSIKPTTPPTPIPPTFVCSTFAPNPQNPPALPNPDGVTAEQWQSMADLLSAELSAAIALTEYISDVSSLITSLYFDNESDFNNTVYALFPAPPSPSNNLFTELFPLFVGLARSAAIVAGIGIISGTLLAMQTIFNALDTMQTPTNNANTKEVRLSEVQAYLSTTTAEALSRQQDIYQYIAADRGLLTLYGEMLNQGFWNLTDDRRNAMTSLIEYHTSVWIYQTLTPLFWGIGVCDTYEGGCWGGFYANIGENAAYIDSDWVAYLAHNPNNKPVFEGITPDGYSGALFQRVFDANAEGTCIVGGTNPDTNWTNDSSACNADVDIYDVLFWRNGWDNFSCTVYLAFGIEQLACGSEDTPSNYPPPAS